MGYALTWVATRGLLPEQFRQRMGLTASGAREDIPDSDITGVQLLSGWYVILVNGISSDLLETDPLRLVSRGCELIACWVEEHGMESGASAWVDGRPVWLVSHCGEDGSYDLAVEGDTPSSFEQLRTEAIRAQGLSDRQQADVDHIFDVPIALAENLTSFRHDQDPEAEDDEPFEVLVPVHPTGRWLGWHP